MAKSQLILLVWFGLLTIGGVETATLAAETVSPDLKSLTSELRSASPDKLDDIWQRVGRRGKAAMPMIIEMLRDGIPVDAHMAGFLEGVGSDAAEALPHLDQQLVDPIAVYFSLQASEAISPGHTSTLPRQMRLNASQALYRSVNATFGDLFLLLDEKAFWQKYAGIQDHLRARPAQDILVWHIGYTLTQVRLRIFAFQLLGDAADPEWVKLLRSWIPLYRETAVCALTEVSPLSPVLSKEIARVMSAASGK
jgi:hypothetical protein